VKGDQFLIFKNCNLQYTYTQLYTFTLTCGDSYTENSKKHKRL